MSSDCQECERNFGPVLLSLEQASGCCGELVQTHVAGAPGSVVQWVWSRSKNAFPTSSQVRPVPLVGVAHLAEPRLKSECPASVSCRSVCEAS